MNPFRGAGVALVTPFNEKLDIDFSALKKLVEFQISSGTDYLVVMGTTGESATLDEAEKKAVLDYVIEVNNKRLPIVLGLGGNNTKALSEKLSKSDLSKVDGILSVSPYYNKPSQEGIYLHYKELSQASSKPLILYNVPGRTSSNITSEITLRLAHDFKNIVAVKEASGNLEQVMHIIKNRPKDFLVLSGDDALTFPIICCGGDGVISVVANAFPKKFKEMVSHLFHNDLAKAREIQYSLLDVIHNLYVDGNPSGIKEALQYINICKNYVRLPLTNVTSKTKEKLIKAIDDHN
ncbi:MAG: 4-hydroxy-tetrahydrodipicolinate synthase [Bacteroidia bacterium]